MLRNLITAFMIAATVIALAAGRSAAQTCTAAQFDTLIDEAGQDLRAFTARSQPKLNTKFKALAKHKGWPDSAAQERGYAFVTDPRTSALDTEAGRLLLELDQIDAAAQSDPACQLLDRLKQVISDLRSTTEAKFAHMNALIDRALAPETGKPASSETPPPKSIPKVSATPPAEPAKLPPWQTTTAANQPPAGPTRQPEVSNPSSSAMPLPATYSSAEIREAGRGFFGSISAGLASALQYAFQNYGRPTGYILGTEGGGAFLAGLRYGKGHLHTKMNPATRVYWQGPSIGYDLGVTGSRVMFLVYNLEEPKQIFHRYGGVGGSAYVVGGVGITFHRRGRIVLAPIRTGLGLRVGANIGYLKFSRRRRFNPF